MADINIPDGFFPPPGTPLETKKQLLLAAGLLAAGLIHMQMRTERSGWVSLNKDALVIYEPGLYRIAQRQPRKLGPFESTVTVDTSGGEEKSIYSGYLCTVDRAHAEAKDQGFTSYRVITSSRVEEIIVEPPAPA